MKKKSKKKKEVLSGHEVADDIEYVEKGREEASSGERNTSRGRRSLSSLFRRAGAAGHRARSESPEKSKSANAVSGRHESEGNQDSPSLNPKVNPRRHLGRMTVREALVESKRRGRSPHRSIVKLQKSVLDEQPRDSLSTSLPHILDQFPDPNDITVMDHETPNTGGHTLPRSTRKRRSEIDDISRRNGRTLNKELNENKILPLDKRKYLINKSQTNTSIDVFDSAPSKSPYTSRDISPYNHSSFLDQEVMRRESFAKFLQLRETKPASHSSSLSIDKGSAFSLLHEQRTSPFEVVVPERNAETSAEIMSRNTGTSPLHKPHSSQPFPKGMHNATCEPKHNSIDKKEEDIPNIQHTDEGKDMARRSRASYVSPRRFSRNSRSSENENKVTGEDNNVADIVLGIDRDNKPASKYQRQFSNSSEKAKLKKLKGDKTPNSEAPRETYKPMECIDSKPEEVLYRDPDEIPKYSMKEMQNIIKMLESSRKVETHDESTQTDDIVEPVVRPSILSVKTVESSVDIPHITQDNMFVPISDEPEALDEVFDPPEASLLSTSREPASNEVTTPEGTSDKLEVHNKDNSEATTPSDISKPENNKDESPERVEGKDKMKSKKGKKKSDKKKKKSKSENTKKHDHKHEDNDKHEKKKDTNKHESVKEENKTEVNEIVHSEDEHETGGKHKKVRTLSAKQKKKLKKTMSMKVPKGKLRESRSLSRSGRASSLTDIRVNTEQLKGHAKPGRGKRQLVAQRSRSVEDLSQSDKSLNHHTAFKKAFSSERKAKGTEHSKEHSAKDSKPQPKLSIAAIVAIRSKISRMKKAKLLQAQKRAEEARKSDNDLNNDTSELQEREGDVRDDEPEVSTNDETMNDRVFYENEINASIGKQSESDVVQMDENILSLDKEVKDIVYDKHIHFSSFCDDTLSEEEMIKQRQRNTRLTSRRESKVRQRQKKLISCCKKAVAFLFSHIGLCSLVIGYCIAGGFIFQALEGKAELAQREKMENLRVNFTEKIFGLAMHTIMEKDSRENFRIHVERILKNYSQTIFKHTKEAGWDGNDNYGNETAEVEQWSFPSSLLYAITVMTTIGKSLVLAIIGTSL